MAYKIQLRGDTAANWTSVNPVLAAREFGLETDTRKFKIGDGSTAWASLPYGAVTSGSTSDLSQTVSDKSSNYTIGTGDKGTLIRATSGITITVANVLNVGERVSVLQDSTSGVTFTAGAGVTLGAIGNKLTTNRQYSLVHIQCVASGQYRLFGDLASYNIL